MGILIKCSDNEDLFIAFKVAILIVFGLFLKCSLWNVLFNCGFKMSRGF